MQDSEITKHRSALNSIFDDCQRVIIAHTVEGFQQEVALLHLAETLRLARLAIPSYMSTSVARGCVSIELGDEDGG